MKVCKVCGSDKILDADGFCSDCFGSSVTTVPTNYQSIELDEGSLALFNKPSMVTSTEKCKGCEAELDPLDENVEYCYTCQQQIDRGKGMKFDHNKIAGWSLLPLAQLAEVARVLDYGRKKYAPNSWQQVENGKDRYIDAMFRHLEAMQRGEVVNEKDGGVLHAAQVAVNALFVLYFVMEEIENGKEEE